MMDHGLTVTEFAQRQRVSREIVYRWMRRLPGVGYRVGGLRLLSPEDQRRILATRQKTGRPKKNVDTP